MKGQEQGLLIKELDMEEIQNISERCKLLEESVVNLKNNSLNNKEKQFFDTKCVANMSAILQSIPLRINEICNDYDNNIFSTEKSEVLDYTKKTVETESSRGLDFMKNSVILYHEREEVKQRISLLNSDIRDEQQIINKFEMNNEILDDEFKRKRSALEAIRRERQEVVVINKSLSEQRTVAHKNRLRAEEKLSEIQDKNNEISKKRNELTNNISTLMEETDKLEQILQSKKDDLDFSLKSKSDISNILKTKLEDINKMKKNTILLHQLTKDFEQCSEEVNKLKQLQELKLNYKESTKKLTICQNECIQIKNDIESRCSRIHATTLNIKELRHKTDSKLNEVKLSIDQLTRDIANLKKNSEFLSLEKTTLMTAIEKLELEIRNIEASEVIKEKHSSCVHNKQGPDNFGYSQDANDTVMASDDDDEDDDIFLFNAHKRESFSQNHLIPNINPALDDSLMNTDGEEEGDPFDFTSSFAKLNKKSKPVKTTVMGNASAFDLDESMLNFNSDNFITSTPMIKKETKPTTKGKKAVASRKAPKRQNKRR